MAWKFGLNPFSLNHFDDPNKLPSLIPKPFIAGITIAGTTVLRFDRVNPA